MSIGTAIAPGIAAAASLSTFSPVLSTTRLGLVVRQKTGRDASEVVFARAPPSRAASLLRARRTPARAHATSAAISLSPLFAARRCLLSRCSTLVRSVMTSSSSSASRSPVGSAADAAVVERPQHHEDRVAVAQRSRAPWRRVPHRASCPGGKRDVHELEAGPHDLLRRRHLGEPRRGARRERSRFRPRLRTRSAPAGRSAR